MLGDGGPGRSPLDQIETDHIGGAFYEFLIDLRDLPEVAEEGQCRRTLAGANPLESFYGEREVFRMPGENRLVHLDVRRARPDQGGRFLPQGVREVEGQLFLVTVVLVKRERCEGEWPGEDRFHGGLRIRPRELPLVR